MILKTSLSFFPIIGSPFTLTAGGMVKKATVESVHCECRGPGEPHEHFYVGWTGLNAGDMVILEKDPKKPQTYRLKVRSTAAQRQLCG